MRKVAILGATGSIGSTALRAIAEKSLPLSVTALSCFSRKEKLASLGKAFHVENLCCVGEEGFDALERTIERSDAEIVLNGISGFAGLRASVMVLSQGRDLALANKESVVAGSSFLFNLAKKRGASIIPVDSEHSAIYQLLRGRRREEVQSLVITASGGPFRGCSREEMERVSPTEALRHPTWKMGRRISIDSATLANKAMEVIEASCLFGFPPSRIEVTIHPQSIVHSMIRMKNGAIYAQMGVPDMSNPIISALLPETVEELVRPLDFSSLSLTFEKPDTGRFPLLGLAYEILRRGDVSALAFNASDECAVSAFLEGRIPFTSIATVVEKVTRESSGPAPMNIDEALALDAFYREKARDALCSLSS